MNSFGQGMFFSGGGNLRLAGFRQAPAPRQLAQAAPQESPKVADARSRRDEAAKHLTSVEDNLQMLDFTMGPEAALQAIDEGRESLQAAEADLQEALQEEASSR